MALLSHLHTDPAAGHVCVFVVDPESETDEAQTVVVVVVSPSLHRWEPTLLTLK